MSGIHWKRCQDGQCEILDQLYRDAKEPKPPREKEPRAHRTKAVAQSRIGDYLHVIIERETGYQPCPECSSEIKRLNTMVPTAVRNDSLLLATRIVQRAKQKAHPWYDVVGRLRQFAAEFAPAMTASVVVSWIEEACEKEEADPVIKPEPPRPPSKSVKPQHLGVRPDFPPVPTADLSEAKRHIMFHMWPLRETDSWQWHIRNLAARWHLFNGTRILSCAIDSRTVHESEVIEYGKRFGVEWNHVIARPNNPTVGEVDSWECKIRLLPPATEHDVVFYGHSKGVRVRTNTTAVRLWTQLMYEANLDYWPIMQSVLEENIFGGALRRLDHYRLPGNFRWHYSGTFYWFRWLPVSQRHPEKIHRKYIGTEAWPGGKARREEGGVIFLDDMRHSLYDEPTMTQVVWPMWDAWKKQRHHLRTEENMSSQWCVNFARYLPPGSVEGKQVLEIGAYDVNGSCRQLLMARGPAHYLGTDMQAGPGVDVVCKAEDLPGLLSVESQDLIICTEVLEHVQDWKVFLQRLWSLLRNDGFLLLTTRSPGFPRHDYPNDYWRFTTDTLSDFFSMQDIYTLTRDPTPDPGVGIIVRKCSKHLDHTVFALPAPEQ